MCIKEVSLALPTTTIRREDKEGSALEAKTFEVCRERRDDRGCFHIPGKCYGRVSSKAYYVTTSTSLGGDSKRYNTRTKASME